jgi:internalin A
VALHSALFSADALVKADEKAKRITVAVMGKQRRDYFAAVRDAFAEIHQSFEKLSVTELVPLPDRPDVLLEYRELIGYENAGRDEYFIGRIGSSYQVKDLLNGIVDENRRKDDRISMTFNVSGD